LTAFRTSDGFSPLRIRMIPVTISSFSFILRTWRGTELTSTVATSRTNRGVPPCSARMMLPMSSDERSSPIPRIRYC
jgi:hypothetical protein